MSIPTTLGALVRAEPALDRLLELRLSGPRLYQIAKLVTLVRKETAIYHDKRRQAVIDCGAARATVTDQERALFGASMTEVTSDKIEAFATRVGDLEKVAVEIAWTPLSFGDDLVLSGAEILALGALLAEPTP